MKIWYGYGSEHSANLVLIGHFDSADKAQAALELLNEAAAVARADDDDGLLQPGRREFSERQMELFRRKSLSVNYGDPEQFLSDYNARRVGNQVVITTEENDINAFLKVLLHEGGKIEVYSAHNYASPYGRQTYQGG